MVELDAGFSILDAGFSKTTIHFAHCVRSVAAVRHIRKARTRFTYMLFLIIKYLAILCEVICLLISWICFKTIHFASYVRSVADPRRCFQLFMFLRFFLSTEFHHFSYK